MAMTLVIGWWGVPLLITIVTMVWVMWPSGNQFSNSGYGIDVTPLLKLGAAVIVSLVSWLIWALLR